MSDAFSGVGAKLYRQNPNTNVWEAFAEVNDIGGPDISRDTIDVTSLDSTGGYREFIGGFRDGGEVTMGMNFTNANMDKLKSDIEAAAVRNYKIVLPDDDESIFSFSGLVTGIGVSVPMDDKVTADVTIKVSGQTNFYAGSTTTTTT